MNGIDPDQAEELNNITPEPQVFEDGFTVRTIIGALFVGFIMMPGAMYLGLVAGQGLGPAAQWVTIVLFSEIARRSFQPLKKQELYILFYISGGIAGAALMNLGLSGGPFAGLIWSQYLVQCPQISNLAHQIPNWVAPAANDPSLAARTFVSHAWLVPICLIVTNEILGRMIWIGGGYALFRVTSDIEHLPFPMAPIAVAGATALAEASSKEEGWRWRVFSVGSVVGLVFGLVYVCVPIVTGVVFSKPLTLIPIPWFDFTSNTEHFLPSSWSAVSGDLGNVMVGMVIPFPILLGQFISCIACKIFLNPILFHMGMFPHWRYGTPYLQTELTTNIDFWMSVGIGTALGVGVLGLAALVKVGLKFRQDASRPTIARTIPAGRGDWNIWLSIAAWLCGTLIQIAIAHRFVPGFPLWIMGFYGLIYTPVISYVSGRMIGLTGMGVTVPYLREATIIKSGYTRSDIWFAGMPMNDLGPIAQRFREVELTGTKFTSIVKAEILMFIVIVPTSFMFWSFFWKTSPIPSAQFPFAERIWPQQAALQSIWWTANRGIISQNWLLAALRPNVMAIAGVGTVAAYGVAMFFKLPLLFFYGFIGGIGASPVAIIPQFGGALLGKYYFSKRFGDVKWRNYAPVLCAGFGCGVGLMGMTAIALALIMKSVNYLPF